MQVRLQTKLDEELIPNGSAAQGRTNKREWGKVSPFAEKIIRDTASMQEFHTSVVLLRGTIEKQTSSRQKYFDYLEERSFKNPGLWTEKFSGTKSLGEATVYFAHFVERFQWKKHIRWDRQKTEKKVRLERIRSQGLIIVSSSEI